MADYLRHSLDGCFERIRRADEHLADLRNRIAIVTARQAQAVSADFNPRPPYDWHITGPTETYVEIRIGILIGEIVYNLRAALDYLVFELAKLDSGREQAGTQFPIESTRQGFIAHEQIWLNGINPTHRAAIERVQPYNGCYWAQLLRDISNRDKHRKLAHIEGECRVHAYSRFADANFDDIHATITRRHHPIHGEVDVKIHIYCPITFGSTTPIVDELENLKMGVADTLNAFKPEF